MVILICTIKPYGLNTKSVDIYLHRLLKNITQNYKMMMNLMFLTSMLSQPTPGINNLSDYLVRIKLC